MVKLTIEVPWESVLPHLKRVAKEYAEAHPIPGFRKGQAPYEVIEQKLGAAALLELAQETIVARTYVEALRREELTTVGPPQVNITARTAHMPFRYEATVALVPQVKLALLDGFTVQRQPQAVTQADVEKLLEELRWLKAQEREIAGTAQIGHKVTIQYRLSQNGVPLEGGAHQGSDLILGKTQVLPEFAERLQGMRAGEERRFTVKFPDTWSRKDLAGRRVEVELTLKRVSAIDLPEINDAFAQSLGKFENLRALQIQLENNIRKEKEGREENRVAAEAVRRIVAKSEFSDIPDILIEGETDRLFEEMGASLKESGIALKDWLARVRKDEQVLRQELQPQAKERVQSSLILRTVAREQAIEADDGEVLEEMQAILNRSGGDPQVRERIQSHEFHEQVKHRIIMRKAVEWIKEKVVK